MSNKALVVGIDYYENGNPLHGCVNDAHTVKAALERHGDGSVNFGVKLLTGTGPGDQVSRAELKENVDQLFRGKSETALFYFAGHGHIEATGGYLLGSDSRSGDEGLPLADVMAFASASNARNKVIILDSCHSGIAGQAPRAGSAAELVDGITILTASTAEQYASEMNGHGVFTTLLVDALNGAAANLVGDVTPGGLYAHIDQSLGPWEQRPVFKTNVKGFVSLRKVQPAVPTSELRRISEFFPTPGYDYPLDPAFEPRSGTPDATKNAIFAILQRFNRASLVTPVGAEHMYDAAMDKKWCKLTVLGEHYRALAARGRI